MLNAFDEFRVHRIADVVDDHGDQFTGIIIRLLSILARDISDFFRGIVYSLQGIGINPLGMYESARRSGYGYMRGLGYVAQTGMASRGRFTAHGFSFPIFLTDTSPICNASSHSKQINAKYHTF